MSFVEDGAILLDDDGRIADLGPFAEVEARHPGVVILDARPRWILPGLIDLHTHVPQYEAVARGGEELLPWLQAHIYPAEARFENTEVATQAARKFFTDLVGAGTTTVVAFGSIHAEATHALFQEAERVGIRAILGKVQMDLREASPMAESTEASLAQSEELCQQWHGQRHGRLMYAFAPRFAPACSMELMRGSARLANKYGAYIQTHVGENLGELALVKQLFPEAAHYTDVYRRAGMLTPRTLLAHGIHLTQAERDLIRTSGASLVHCPRSNAFLRSGTLPLQRWLGEGLQVGLGTDVGAGPSLSLWHEMAAACSTSALRVAQQQLQRERLGAMKELAEHQRQQLIQELDLAPEDPVGVRQAFWMATLGGARALGLEHRIGSLEVGKDADFIVVEPRVTDPAGDTRPAEPPEEVLSRLVYRGDPFMVRATFVRGQQCGLRVS